MHSAASSSSLARSSSSSSSAPFASTAAPSTAAPSTAAPSTAAPSTASSASWVVRPPLAASHALVRERTSAATDCWYTRSISTDGSGRSPLRSSVSGLVPGRE